MSAPTLTLRLLPEALAVARVDQGDGVPPPWAFAGEGIAAVVRRADELSAVCSEHAVPDDVVAERGWRALEVAGPLDLELTGILAALAGVLADAGVPIFALSTYDTDLLLVRVARVGDAVRALERAGHRVVGAPAADR